MVGQLTACIGGFVAQPVKLRAQSIAITAEVLLTFRGCIAGLLDLTVEPALLLLCIALGGRYCLGKFGLH